MFAVDDYKEALGKAFGGDASNLKEEQVAELAHRAKFVSRAGVSTT